VYSVLSRHSQAFFSLSGVYSFISGHSQAFFSLSGVNSFLSGHSLSYFSLRGVYSVLSGHSLSFFCLRGVNSFLSRHSKFFFRLSGADLPFHATYTFSFAFTSRIIATSARHDLAVSFIVIFSLYFVESQKSKYKQRWLRPFEK
jgi:preprotein translocase subunit SecG